MVLLSLFFVLAIPMAWSNSAVTLAWDANTETNLAGYKVYYGAASGVYTNTLDAGNITTNRVTGLAEGVTYYFAVTAYNTSGQESDYSTEISYLAALPNQPPSISQVPDQQALLNTLVVVPFTVGDNETPAAGLVVGSFAADPSLVASITLSGIGSNRVATIVPGLGLAGSSVITLWVSDGVLSNAAIFRVSFSPLPAILLPPPNTPPFISSIANQATMEDVPTSAIPFLIGDNETPASNLLVTVTSSNPSLLPLSGIQLGGTGANRALLLQPTTNQFGTALVTVSVSDGVLSTSATFQLAVAAVNDRPEISAIANQTINEGTVSALIGFTVSDVDSPLTSLVVSAISSNPNLISSSSLSLGSSVDGSHRTLLLTPTANQFGASTITVTVSDGFLTNSTSFLLAIPMAWSNSAVTLGWDSNTETNLAGYKVYSGVASGVYTNSVDVGNITTYGVTGLVQGVTYYFAVTAYNTSGQESDYSTEISYLAAPTNPPPSISQVPDQQALFNTSVVVPFTVGDNGMPADALVVGSFAADPNLVASITLSGIGSNRVATIVPALGLAGSSAVTLWVSDGVLSNAASFRVSFATSANPPATNTPPFISSIANQATLEDVPTSAIPFLIGDNETSASNLLVTVTSSNPSLLPLSGIQLGGAGANRTLLLQPATNQFGTAIVTVSVSDGSLSTAATFQLVVAAVNDRPEISPIANQTINEDTVSALLGFTVSDVDSPLTNLIVSATSSNPNLISSSSSSLSLGSSVDGSHRTLLLTPAANQFGASTITVTVSDGFLTNSTSFLLAVNPVNDPPTISSIPNQTINEDSATAALPFTIGDVDNSVSNLVVSANSSNPTLIPPGAIQLGGSASSRTVTLQPATNQSGTATITLTVSDGALSASTSFILIVNPVNDSPVVSTLSNQVLNEDTASAILPFTVGDVETPASNLVVTASSSNPGLVSASGLQLGGAGSNRTLQIRPTTNQSGTATITLAVSDGVLTTASSFLLTVNPVNDAPTISSIPGQTVNEDTATASIPVTISDVDSPASNLVLSATSSNPVLVPPSAIVFGGSGSNRTAKILPATNLFGTATITLVVSDGNLSSSSSFVLTVNSVNDAPSLSTFNPLAIARSSSAGPIAFLVGDAETPATNLLLTASSSNLYLIATNGITFGGSGSNRTVNIKPVRRRTGTASITIKVSDGVLTSSNTFLVTVGSASFAAVPSTDAEMLAADLDGDSVLVSWVTTPGSTYRLLSTTNLNPPLWIPAAPDIQATDVVTSWGGSSTNATARFYRVQKIK